MILSQCNDYAILPIINVLKNIFMMMLIIGPALSIVSLSILFFKLMMNPEDNNDKIKHGIKNSLISLVILFLLPVLINLVMYVLGNSFTVSSCWNNVETFKFSRGKYIEKENEKDKVKIINDKTYDNGTKTKSSSDYSTDESKNMADAFVKLALAQKKDPSAYGGRKYWSYLGYNHRVGWCAAFVSWVIGNTGYNGEKMTKYFNYKAGGCDKFVKYCKSKKGCTYHDGSDYTPKRGDIIVFTWDNRETVGHIGIVQYVKKGTIKTIEGNVSDRVCERNVKVGNKTIYGIISWS